MPRSDRYVANMNWRTRFNKLKELEQQYISRKDAAKYLGMSEKWLAQTGRYLVPHYKFGGSCQYKLSDLDNWARQQRVMR
ncbi:helix-turn-helix domain-containing protein [Arthrobacter sp. I2-34]|uniref:Helix-turn-helix domain-containing protein n=1 Tax=Arthrobacter hankyongi TaxID=2904801 RepID=A0ABS9LDC8_9MICC|nr:helix-turn-helix domain-containing protein [Arthrobacter hankyongi]MCG2624702.1 helix-turn-helix domain-containing protein [Arthrobacter hankyongi]